MTLEEVSKVGELVTESMDDDANVIWGARIDDNMTGKLTVITLMTGVKSPWILGKVTARSAKKTQKRVLSQELDLELIY